MTRQLILDLPVRPALGRDDFFVSPANARALAVLDAPQSWPQGKLLLIGPPGAGKSHLAAVWAAKFGAAVVQARDLAEATVPGFARQAAIAVEDAQRIAGLPELETALFHLHNLCLASGGHLLLTAGQPVKAWGLQLADLTSRLQATAVARLEAPDDALLAAVLVKLFADRQVSVAPPLIAYLVARIERSFASARQLVAALDARALAQGRPINRSLAAEVLDSLTPGTP